MYISIHASAREATQTNDIYLLIRFYFNPRLREGGDPSTWLEHGAAYNFNPRLREGGDSFWAMLDKIARYFNPRLREGGDTDGE